MATYARCGRLSPASLCRAALLSGSLGDFSPQPTSHLRVVCSKVRVRLRGLEILPLSYGPGPFLPCMRLLAENFPNYPAQTPLSRQSKKFFSKISALLGFLLYLGASKQDCVKNGRIFLSLRVAKLADAALRAAAGRARFAAVLRI